MQKQLHIAVISVDNFYWILWQNLLRPCDLDCWYYYPWGTQDNLAKFQFTTLDNKRSWSHVFFHFDQEPLKSQELGLYDLEPHAYNGKSVKILANSERSEIKKSICRSRGFLDWYFFYHGFAALDWFRDAKYVTQNHSIKNAFLSLNHNMEQRSYRLSLLARLLKHKIASQGSISFYITPEKIHEELRNPHTQLSQISQDLIRQHLCGISDWPWKLDHVPVDGNLSARFGHQEYCLWQQSLWHVVNETVFYEPKLHLTEKVFKPIVAQRPFLLVAAPGNLAYIRGYGFETFGNWIDESYDNITDADQRLDAISKEIVRLANMSVSQLNAMHQEMLSVLEHNKQHFFGKFREIIIEELVDNFDTCIRIWNNGRMDGRERALPDSHSVKKLLLA